MRLSVGFLAVLLVVGCGDDSTVTERFREWNRHVDVDGLIYEKGILHLPGEPQPAGRCVLGYPWRKVTQSEADAAARYVAGLEAEAREQARLRAEMMAEEREEMTVEDAGGETAEAVEAPAEVPVLEKVEEVDVLAERPVPLPDALVVPLTFVLRGLRLPDRVGDRFVLHLLDDAPVVRDGVLEMTVSYAGGCREHDFELLAADVFRLPGRDRVLLDVILTHEAGFDPCDGEVERQRLEVSLDGVRERFERAFAARQSTLALVFRLPAGSACEVLEVPYDLS